MLVVVSPAKRLDWAERDLSMTQPPFQDQTQALVETARELSVEDLQKLMKLSPDLARLNVERFRDFEMHPNDQDLRPAAFAFAGDTYAGLESPSLDKDELAWAQDHLAILSGLYGLLRPLDGIQPYRLEMGTRLKTAHGKSLYDFWGTQIAQLLTDRAQQSGANVLVNCASQEYFGAVDLSALSVPVVTPTFLEDKPGGPKVVSFFAKKARGAMARFIIQNRLTDPAALQEFDTGGYVYQPSMSEPNAPVFLRGPDAV
ncbi:MAG: peroxide stress protein YaaA [Pelagimonas sp.]|jgi:cytoplasmic iron level regulating protein YaaA (DUF328/UPF0246 family)|nr:peroxide stress protein YaaA [Pelagimonas sp.]